MKIDKKGLAIGLVVLALLMSVHVALTFGVEKETKQEPVEVPVVIQAKEWCGDCLKKPLQKISDRPVLKRVSGIASKLRSKKKPVRSLLRRWKNR